MRQSVSRSLSVAVFAALVAASACGSEGDGGPAVATDEQGTPAGATVAFGLVTPEQAAGLAADASITVVDVRTPDEYEAGHLADARLIDFNGSDFHARIAELDPEATYLVYCRSGNRSSGAVAAMAEIGIDRVYELDGGIVAYEAAGLPLRG